MKKKDLPIFAVNGDFLFEYLINFHTGDHLGEITSFTKPTVSVSQFHIVSHSFFSNVFGPIEFLTGVIKVSEWTALRPSDVFLGTVSNSNDSQSKCKERQITGTS